LHVNAWPTIDGRPFDEFIGRPAFIGRLVTVEQISSIGRVVAVRAGVGGFVEGSLCPAISSR
jgi:hypothetical protein